MQIWIRELILLTALAVLAAPQTAWAQLKSAPGEWPAWRGPDRNGISTETGLLKHWPEGGPKLAWKITGLGDGYSTVAVAGGRIYVLGSKGRTEYVFALDARDGAPLWSTPVGAEAGGYPGPRSTPTVDGDRVYALSSNGRLVCLGADKGNLIWQKDLMADFKGRHGNWAYAESPLIDGNRLICTPGGESATMVALNKKDGALLWKASITGLKAKQKPAGGRPGRGGMRTYAEAGYSSPIVAEVAGVRQYIQFLAGGVVGVAASDGKLLWHYDNPAAAGANIATPLFHDNSVFAASAYGNGGGRAIIKRDGDAFKAEEVFFLSKMQNHHGGMVLVGDHIYGAAGQALMCVNFKDGAVAWQARGVGKGAVAYADGHIYHRGENGDMALVEATPAGYKETGRFHQPDRSSKKAWAHPVIAGGKLYLRDWDVLLCYDIKEK